MVGGIAAGEAREFAQVGRSRADTPAPAERGAGSYLYEAEAPAVVADARPRDISGPDFNTEAYDRIEDNQFLEVLQNPLSTFSIDVDTASYANVRRFLQGGTLPPKDAVRIEEMLNYFSYNYPVPSGEGPFSASVEVAQAPWRLEHRLVRIGLKGQVVETEKRPSSNLVFLLDVSGSMQPANKLPLLKEAMRLLVDRLSEKDRVAMVVYAGASGLVLPSTSSDQKGKILAALDHLEAGGSTNGGSGIRLAYQTAVSHFISGGINRVILATDGDFNVGTTNQGDLTRLIEENAKSGVFLTVLGFGMGNYKDSTLEKLADQGNGNYAYIDNINEARKVLVDEINSTLVTIAKDVKIQIEFNPLQVSAYRLIGYENRLLRKEDFNDDTKDAGEIGAGHTVTALYEIVPAGRGLPIPGVDPLKYQTPMSTTDVAQGGELLTLKLRYKQPEGQTSQLLEFPVRDGDKAYSRASQDFKFAAAVASFGMILRQSPHKGNGTLDAVLELAEEGKGSDRHGYRAEFLELVKQARALSDSDAGPNR
jgi:Ca-activated chloride channel family protein